MSERAARQGPMRSVSAGFRFRGSQGCGDCGVCGYGCRRGAKRSTLVTYLADACAKGAGIIPGCHVDSITASNGRVTGSLAASRRRHPGEAPPQCSRAAQSGRRVAATVEAGGPTVGKELHLHPVAPVSACTTTWCACGGRPQSVVSDALPASTARTDSGWRSFSADRCARCVAAVAFRGGVSRAHRRADHASVISRSSGPRVRASDRDPRGRPSQLPRAWPDGASRDASIVEATACNSRMARPRSSPCTPTLFGFIRGTTWRAFAREVERRGIGPTALAFSAHQMSTAGWVRRPGPPWPSGWTSPRG